MSTLFLRSPVPRSVASLSNRFEVLVAEGSSIELVAEAALAREAGAGCRGRRLSFTWHTVEIAVRARA
jgi:hypothetical protein